MNGEALAELDSIEVTVRRAYIRFTTANGLLVRRGLTESERAIAEEAHSKAFEDLTVNLGRMNDLCHILFPPTHSDQERRRAPRYSSDMRRGCQNHTPKF